MEKILPKKGWLKMTPSNIEECGLCENLMLAGRTQLMVEFLPEKKKQEAERYLIEICDSCRRLVCTCDLCAAFNKQIVEPDDDEDDDEEELGEEPQFEVWCQLTQEMEETDDEDWCLKWQQSRIITEGELHWRLEGRPGTEEESDNEATEE